jgi:uncharacterized repeat protein (TIGR02543 family)
VTAGGELVDSNEENNVEDGIKLASPDLTVNAKYVVVGDIKYMLVIVQNTGTLPIGGYTIYVANGILEADETVENALYEFYCCTDSEARSLGEYALSAGEYKYYTVELNKVYFTDNYVTLAVVSDDGTIAESNTANNHMSFSMEQNEPVDFGTSYTLNYYVNRELVYSTVYKAGATIDTSAVDQFEVREGYTFSGWSVESEVMPAHDLNVYGYFTANRYNVNYYVDGEIVYTDSIEYGSQIPVRDEDVREGHTFDGWYTTDNWDNTGTKFTAGKMGDSDISLYGKHVANTYTVTYYVDSVPYKKVNYTYADVITIPEYSVEIGRDFSGWSLPFGVSTMPAYNLDLYATTQIKFYTLTYKIQGSGGEYTVVREIPVHYNGTIPYYNYVAPEGYTFGGWYDAEENGNPVKYDDNKKMPDQNLTLYGKNTVNKYSVTYYVNDIDVNTVYVTYGEVIPEYTYVQDDTEIKTWINLPETMPARNIVVYSVATSDMYTVDYYVDGEYAYTDSYPYGIKVNLRIPEPREGYSFAGWIGSDAFINGTMPGKNVRLDADFAINSYTLSYYVDGKLWKEVQYTFGASVRQEEYIPAEGYSFTNWSKIPETMPAANITVYGATATNMYTVNYYIGTSSEPIHKAVVPYGAKIPDFKYPAPIGYTLGVWEGLEETMPAHDLTVSAALIPNEYTLTYYVDGVPVKTVEYTYGASIETYVYEVSAGKIFRGFDEIPVTMPARSVNVYGYTESVVYRLNYYVDGSLVYTDLYAYDELITLRDNAVRYGYTFSGWGTVDRRMPANDLNVYGTFTKNKHKVSYYVDNQLLHTDEYEFGEQITAYVPNPIVGYTFNGWELLPGLMQDEDIEVRGSYSANRYTVSYYVNGQFYKAVNLAYGQDVDLSLFEEDTYAVTAWTIDGNTVTELTMGASDVRLDAVTEDTTPFVEKPAFAALVAGAGTSTLTAGAFLTILWLKKKHAIKLDRLSELWRRDTDSD